MDPQATLYDLLDAMQRNDRTEVDLHLESLRSWNSKGGFQPQVLRPSNNDPACFVVYRRAPGSAERV